MYTTTEKIKINASTAKAIDVAYLVTRWLLNNGNFYFTKLEVKSLTIEPKPVPAMVKTKGQKSITVTAKVVPYGKIFDLKFQFEIANYEMEYGTEWFVWSHYWPTVVIRTNSYNEPLELLFRQKSEGVIISLKSKDISEERAKEIFENFKKSLPLHPLEK